MAEAELSGERSISARAAFMVNNILVPVSPSGTGNTFRALTAAACFSSQWPAATRRCLRHWPSQVEMGDEGFEVEACESDLLFVIRYSCQSSWLTRRPWTCTFTLA